MEQIFVTVLLSLPAVGAYAINAIGIVVVYRASKVLNLAHGAMAMLAAFSAYQVVQWGLPRGVGLLAGIVVSVLVALVVERVFVRRLRAGGPTAQTIGTVAAFGVIVATAGQVWGTTPRLSVPVFPEKGFQVASTVITVGQIGLFVSMLVIAVGLYTLLQRTYLGLVLRGTAENRMAASLMGADPDRFTRLAWIIGGVLAGVAGEMLAAIGSLHPYNLALSALPAYVAALIGGMVSLPGAVAGAAVVGLLEGLIPLVGPLEGLQGNGQLAIGLVALAVMASRGARFAGTDDDSTALETPRAIETPTCRRFALAGVIAIIAVPWLPFVSFSLLGNLNTAAIYALVAVSLVLLTGWVGQISLAHATFVGIAAFMTGILINTYSIPFPLNLPIAAAVAGTTAALLGVIALRVRGLYLAVATMIFAWVGDAFLFRQSWLTDQAAVFIDPVGREGGFPPAFDVTDRRVFFYLAWAAVVLIVLAAANLRDTKVGRAFFAVRGSEVAAASLGIDVTRYKLMAFVLSGTVAGVAGNLMMVQQRGVIPEDFAVTASLFFLAVLVVGGLESLSGAVAAGLLFGVIEEVFSQSASLSSFFELSSALLLAAVLLAYRRGLAGVPETLSGLWARFPRLVRLGGRTRSLIDRTSAAIRRAMRRVGNRTDAAMRAPARALAAMVRAEREAEAAGPDPVAVAVVSDRAELPEDRHERAPLLEADGITVRFGGLTAADHVEVKVFEGEIVGLIGPNGAGKTTTFNAIAGLNEPAEGTVRLFGTDVTKLPVHKRAAMGVGRTFQHIQLFPQLTVAENLLVATHLENDSGLVGGLTAGSRSLIAEARARARVRETIGLLKLDEFADRPVGGLPFGVLRMIEVGRAMVANPRLIMLDEPASGLDNTETDRLSELLLNVRELGVGLLLIEHDVRMVTSVSDYMYVINQGAPLADGTPAEVQRNPDVIAAYLGRSADEDAGGEPEKDPGRPSRSATTVPTKPAGEPESGASPSPHEIEPTDEKVRA